MKKQKHGLSGRNLMLIWVLGMAGQICWNVENQWFNTFIYAEIAPNSEIVNWMVSISAIMTTFSTFFFGTLSDRVGKRKPFLVIGYIIWGLFTIVYGTTMYVPHSISGYIMVAAILIIMADALMSFCGSMGNDSGFNAWLSDQLDDTNKGAIGTALAVQPVLGTIIGTVIGGVIIAVAGYMAFFTAMGVLVIIFGILSIFIMKDSPDLVPHKEGTFWQQFASVFNFKKFFAMKELVWINIVIMVFFIGFNCYFAHIGNIMIYNFGFTADNFGYIEGVGLILAICCAPLTNKFIKKDKSPELLAVVFAINIVGLLVLYFLGGISDHANLFSIANLPLFLGIILIGIGYIITMQVTMVWAKELYPKEAKGQFEGIRILFFVLFPMVIGPAIANPIINSFGPTFDITYPTGVITGQVPPVTLFLAAAIITVLAYIPLFFVTKHFKARVAKKNTVVEAKEAE